MMLSKQQKYIIEVLKQLKYLRVRQLHAILWTYYQPKGIEINQKRMDAMLRQLHIGSNIVFLQGDLVLLGRREVSERYLEAIDVMLELTENTPVFYSCERLQEPFLLRFSGDGEMSGLIFSVAHLDISGRIAATPRMKGERIIWVSDSADIGTLTLPRHHFFAARQEDGTHRFFGSSEPEKIHDQEE